MKRLLIITFLIISIFSFSKDNYIFDEDRIMKVFSEYELIDSSSDGNIWLYFVDRETDTRIQISNDITGDTLAKSMENFRKTSIVDNKSTPNPEINQLSMYYLEHSSISLAGRTAYVYRNLENFFFDKVKISIDYSGDEKEYQNTLILVREAIDPSVPLKNRENKTFTQNYSIENFIDRIKLEANFKRVYRNVKIEEIKGNQLSPSSYKITIESENLPRAVWIRANNNYSKKVMDRRNHFEIQSFAFNDSESIDYAYVHRVHENIITSRYFGVSAEIYENDNMPRPLYVSGKIDEEMLKELDVSVVGIIRYATTDNYTIRVATSVTDGDREEELKEYEVFLSLIKSSLE